MYGSGRGDSLSSQSRSDLVHFDWRISGGTKDLKLEDLDWLQVEYRECSSCTDNCDIVQT